MHKVDNMLSCIVSRIQKSHHAFGIDFPIIGFTQVGEKLINAGTTQSRLDFLQVKPRVKMRTSLGSLKMLADIELHLEPGKPKRGQLSHLISEHHNSVSNSSPQLL